MKLSKTSLLTALASLLLTTAHAQNPPRPNAFILFSEQAGSTTDIDNMRVVDLDTGIVVYTNSFNTAADATNNLNLFYWPVGGSDTTNYVVNGSMTRVVSGKLRLETTGFGANGSGGYNSHSDAEFSAMLPRNFLVDFDAIRLQWAGHFRVRAFYRQPTDSFSCFAPGGSFSTNRSPALRLDWMDMNASGSWFNPFGYVTNGFWAQSFPAPAGSLLSTHRLGFSLSNYVARFYLDGVLLNSADISAWTSATSAERVSLLKAVKPTFSGLAVGNNYQLQVSTNSITWTNHQPPFLATNTSMVYPQYWDVDNWDKMFFRLQRQ